MSGLRELDLSFNMLSGPLPPWNGTFPARFVNTTVANVTQLSRLYLGNNNLEGASIAWQSIHPERVHLRVHTCIRACVCVCWGGRAICACAQCHAGVSVGAPCAPC